MSWVVLPLLLAALGFGGGTQAEAQTESLQDLYEASIQAFERRDFENARDRLLTLLQRKENVPEAHNLLAVAYDLLGNVQQARVHFGRSIELNPYYSEARINFARFLVKQGESKAAIPHLETALRSTGQSQVGLQLARVHFLAHHYQNTLDVLQQIEPLPEQMGEWSLLGGLAYARLEQFEKARKLLEEALKQDPGQLELQLELGQIYLQLGEATKASTLLSRAAAAQPMNPKVHFALSQAFAAGGLFDDAVSAGESALTLSPEMAEYRLNLALLFFERQEFQKCIVVLEGGHSENRNKDEWNLLGNCYGKLGVDEKAVWAFQNSVSQVERQIEGYYNLGLIWLRKRAYENALQVFESALGFFPDSMQILLGMAVAYQLKGGFESARDYIDQALALDPQSAEVHYYLAGALLESGNQQSAFDEFKKAAALDPGDFRPHYFLSVLSFRRGEPDRALEHVSESLKLKPDFAHGYHQMARIHLAKNNLNEALESCLRGVELDSKLPHIHYLLAQVYARLGEDEKATRQARVYEQAKNAYGDREYRVFAVP